MIPPADDRSDQASGILNHPRSSGNASASPPCARLGGVACAPAAGAADPAGSPTGRVGIRRGGHDPDPARPGEERQLELARVAQPRGASTWPRVAAVDRVGLTAAVGTSSNNLDPAGTAPPRRSALRQSLGPGAFPWRGRPTAKPAAPRSGPLPAERANAAEALNGSQLNGTSKKLGVPPINTPPADAETAASCSSLSCLAAG